MAAEPRRVVVLLYPGVQLLDVAGPADVFVAADRLRRRARETYAVELVAQRRAAVRTFAEVDLVPHRQVDEIKGPIDTLVVPGGEGAEAVLRDRRLIAWVKQTAGRARRVMGVCSGAFLLAEAGLLDGRRATTHWHVAEQLASRYPRVRVEADRIFVRDGAVWTSAGVTAGMDLALALVEEDCGRRLAVAVARALVMFVKRPGGQSQFSAPLSVQEAERPGLRELQAWIAERPAADLSVDVLARRSAMSVRNFARAFRRDVGVTPARFVERIRVEAARRHLEDSAVGLEDVATRAGFRTAEVMRRAFHRTVHVSPAAYRRGFRGGV